MKRIIRHFLIEAFALYLVTQFASGMSFESGEKTFLIASAAITAATLFGKPVINIFLLPLNLVTFGLFRWVSSAIALYLVALVVDGFSVNYFQFNGINSQWIELPSIHLNGAFAYIGFSFLLSFITSFLHWIRK